MRFKSSEIKTLDDLKKYYNVKLSEKLKENDRYLAIRQIRHTAIILGIKNGIIKKEPCLKCGRVKDIEAHHPTENKPFQIIWLCKKHHTEIHNYAHLRSWIKKQTVKII